MKKGFTLIELLAVIVILAIIALIAIPTITNIVEKAKMGAAKNSVLGYIDAIEKQVAINLLNSDETDDIKAGTYTIDELTTKKVVVKGKVPTGTVTVNGKGEVTDYELVIDNYAITPTNGDPNKPNAEKNNKPKVVFGGTKVVASGNDTHKGIVYMDPTDLSKACTENDVNANTNDNGTLTGIKTGCMRFYIFNDEGPNYKLILDHNTTAKVAWNLDGINSEMKEAATALSSDTTGWVGNPRLIAADEIAHIVGADREDTIKWSSSKPFVEEADNPSTQSSGFMLYGRYNGNPTVYTSASHGWYEARNKQNPGDSEYAWLYDNTSDCEDYGCNVEESNITGYWTSTGITGFTDGVWIIANRGQMAGSYVDEKRRYGIRPVIEIPKSDING